MLRALIKYLHVELNEREEGLIPLQQAVLLEDPIHPAHRPCAVDTRRVSFLYMLFVAAQAHRAL